MAYKICFLLALYFFQLHFSKTVNASQESHNDFLHFNHKKDADENKIFIRTSRSAAQKNQEAFKSEYHQRCQNTQEPIVEMYSYSSNLTDDPELNFAHSQAYAYLVFLQHRVMVRDDRYFDISAFPSSYQLVFPPQLHIICYHTAGTLTNSSIYLLGNLTTLYKRQLPSKSRAEMLYANRRNEVYQELDLLLTLFRQPGSAAQIKFTEVCKRRSVDITAVLMRFIEDMGLETAPVEFDRKAYNNLVKALIGDLVLYEIVRQGCKAVGHNRDSVRAEDWAIIAGKLTKADLALRSTWHDKQLEQDIGNLIGQNKYAQSSGIGMHNDQINAWLTRKYYWCSFRTFIYLGWTKSQAGSFCTGSPTAKCVEKSGLLVLVRWKDLAEDHPNSKSLNSTFKLQNVAGAPGRNAKAQRIADSITSTVESITAPLQTLKIPETVVSIGENGKALVDTAKTMAKISKVFKTALKVVNTIGKFLGPIASTVCALLSLFEEDGSSEVLDKIDKGFNEMHSRFDQLEHQLVSLRAFVEQKIERETSMWNMYDGYKGRVTYPLDDLREAFSRFEATKDRPFVDKHHPSNADSISALKEVCNHERTKPGNIIHRMHTEFTSTDSAAFGKLLVPWAKDDRFKLQTFLLSRANELGELISLNTKCALYRYAPQLVDTLEDEMATSTERALEIKDALVRLDNEQLYSWQDSLRDELAVRDPKTIDEAAQLANKFEAKYNWNNFSVIIFEAYYPNAIVRGEEVFQHMWLTNPDYSLVHTIRRDPENNKWDMYIIVNWALKTEDGPQLDSGKSEISPYEICNGGFSAFTDKAIRTGKNLKSVFIWRNFIGVGFHMESHSHSYYNPQDRDKFYNQYTHGNPEEGFAGSLVVRRFSQECWHRSEVRRIKRFYNAYISEHKEHNTTLYYVANIGEGY